ncbi:MAG TPA: hypothetical protein VFG09_02065 [Thermodesulfovibrionales bacterium]|nr:hypothetical protein [Thermodesulfovibrionales bacterium]
MLLAFDMSLASKEVLEILIEDAVGPEILEDILKANTDRPEILNLLIESPNVPHGIREEAEKAVSLAAEVEEHPHHKKAILTEDEKKHSLLQRMQALTVGEKIALALRGGRDIRSVLSKDSNKEVVLSVLKNPKVTETEAELVAHSRNIPEDALRLISKNREWMKNYNIVLALVNNPKTPIGIGTTLITQLKSKDLATLEKNKNVSEALRAIAKKLISARRPK